MKDVRPKLHLIHSDHTSQEKEQKKLSPPRTAPYVADIHHEDFRYKTALIQDFLDFVFHAGVGEDLHVLCWRSKTNIPGYPMSEEALLSSISRSPVPSALYYGTSTVLPDPETGKLYNRKALFGELHVVVLDDIGTKIDPAKIPKQIKPSYVIETSPGNFQWGLVLDEPLGYLDMANALLKVVHTAGWTDKGGLMATKVVRLPDGVNGKPKHGQFRVRLVSTDGPVYDPAEIVKLADVGTSWEKIEEDAERAIGSLPGCSGGLSAYMPRPPRNPTIDGIVDPIYEWLDAHKMVLNDSGEWVNIVCPWHEEHSDSNVSAGYSPVGRGDGKYSKYRSFKCFHEHCSGKTAADLLQFVAAQGGPEAGIFDPIPDLLSTYAFDPVSNQFWKVKGVAKPIPFGAQAFGVIHPHKVTVYTADGKPVKIAESRLYMADENKVVVWGQTCDPSTGERIVKGREGYKLNSFTMPPWGAGAYDESQVEPFTLFLNYLIPEDASREYFLDWIAAKAQDMTFRGCGILMTTREFGTGRTTLGGILRELFLPSNTSNIPISEVLSPDKFNEWQESAIVLVDEVLATSQEIMTHKAYERLKQVIDTSPKEVTINHKYGGKSRQMTYSSFFMSSNHPNALAVAEDDRRIMVIQNTYAKWPIDKFVKLHKWLDAKDSKGRPAWALHVWRWLQERKVDRKALMAAPVLNTGKRIMTRMASGDTKEVIVEILNNWPSQIIMQRHVVQELSRYMLQAGYNDPIKFNKAIKTTLRANTVPIDLFDKSGRTMVRGTRGVAFLIPKKFNDLQRELFNKGDMDKYRKLWFLRKAKENYPNDPDIAEIISNAAELYE